jgi:glutamate-5-semialdehyde dehydrogenase
MQHLFPQKGETVMGFHEDCLQVKEAERELALLSTAKKDALLTLFAEKLILNADRIIEQNKLDLADAKKNNIPTPLIDRLRLDEKRIKGMADGVLDVVKLDDPVGRLLEETTRPNGLLIQKISVPLGVIGIIYEARPNVTSDSMALCFKSGNACVLKGGKEAIRSNTMIVLLMKEALSELHCNENYVLLIEDTSRETTNEMMRMKGVIDVLIPRGGKNLIQAVVQNATVPVIETGAGNCHIFVDESADFDMAVNIVDNAKTSRPSVCNAAETLLVHQTIADQVLPLIYDKLKEHNVELRCCERSLQILQEDAVAATEEDYETEYNNYTMAVKIVSNVQEAVAHINRYSTQHSEAIVTEDMQNADYFLQNVDSAAVYVNASTRFTDGGEFGLGAEIGISTQKLHARGPMGLKELTSYKYIIHGNGQIR